MCNLPIVMRLCDRMKITSGASGALEIFWFEPHRFGPRVTGVKGFFDVQQRDLTTSIDLVAQWSLDGVHWKPFSSNITSSPITDEGLNCMNRYILRDEWAPITRFGLSVSGTSSVVSAILTVDLVLETNGAT